MTQYSILSDTLARLGKERARQRSALHRQFLLARRAALFAMKHMIEQQMDPSGAQPENAPSMLRPVVFNTRQLEAFGTGRISDCFGDAFRSYDDLSVPRIPNGDLRMMSRITAIEGVRGDFQRPARITAAYDVPLDAWYFADSSRGEPPVSILMEIALQPCGFLSAYLDTYAIAPGGRFFFRNLDGALRIARAVDLRGRTIETTAQMRSSVSGSGAVIQSFDFRMTCAGQPVCEGESVFGYFSEENMRSQIGLDGGSRAAPSCAGVEVDLARLRAASQGTPALRLASGRFGLIDRLVVRPDGDAGSCVYASRPVNPQDWFYPYHFYGDPVMPGSLGVEAVLESMRAYALHSSLAAGLRAPMFALAAGGPPVTWRYRGQITRQHGLVELQVMLRPPQRQPGRVTLSGDASVWVDGLRIYEIKNAAVAIAEG